MTHSTVLENSARNRLLTDNSVEFPLEPDLVVPEAVKLEE